MIVSCAVGEPTRSTTLALPTNARIRVRDCASNSWRSRFGLRRTHSEASAPPAASRAAKVARPWGAVRTQPGGRARVYVEPRIRVALFDAVGRGAGAFAPAALAPAAAPPAAAAGGAGEV